MIDREKRRGTLRQYPIEDLIEMVLDRDEIISHLLEDIRRTPPEADAELQAAWRVMHIAREVFPCDGVSCETATERANDLRAALDDYDLDTRALLARRK